MIPAMSLISLTLPDGAVRQMETGTTGLDLANAISKSLAKSALAVRVNGDVWDLSRALPDGANVGIITKNDAEALELLRHDCAHVMAQAVQELFPDTQVTIGPSIKDGFYYDFARPSPFSTEDLEAIEKKMRQIIERGDAFIRHEWDRNAAIAHFKEIGEHYKAEIIQDLPEDQTITIYTQGDWKDLCRGPHMPTTRHVGTAFKLMKVAGAYWRGDSKNAMLTRIYGTAWFEQKDLDNYLFQLEEAERRDHRKLGKELDLFHLQDEAQGMVFWHEKGYVIWQALEQYIRRRLRTAKYVEVKTPQLIDRKLWEKSGHWEKFQDNMFTVHVNHEQDKNIETMAVKPMNCPAHVQIFNQGIKSYRDLPIRMAEFGCCHRNEARGALHGIMRVRQMTQDDAHIFCRADQITDESVSFCELLLSVYRDFGFHHVDVKLATRPDVRAGTDETWDRAEQGLRDALDRAGLPYEIAEGEGAFYGPKMEFHLTDAIGRTWQCGTLQLDFVMPERLEAFYVGEDGNKHHPVMLHRAILGSMERFIGILIENHAGKMPLWMSPVQVVVASITSDAEAYATKLYDILYAAGVRVILDNRNEKINYKVREHSLAKVPVMFVVGAREAEQQSVAIRRLGSQDQQVIGFNAAMQDLLEEILPPDLQTHVHDGQGCCGGHR